MTPDPKERHLARQARLVAIVIAGTMALWIGAQFVGGQMGWPPRFALLFDGLAVAGFFWALVVTYRIWRQRRS
jgi:uncharacterized membrane protein